MNKKEKLYYNCKSIDRRIQNNVRCACVLLSKSGRELQFKTNLFMMKVSLVMFTLVKQINNDEYITVTGTISVLWIRLESMTWAVFFSSYFFVFYLRASWLNLKFLNNFIRIKCSKDYWLKKCDIDWLNLCFWINIKQ